MDWTDAVTELHGLTARAEGCVRTPKRVTGDPVVLGRFDGMYSEARGAVEGLVARLVVSLRDGTAQEELAALKGRLGEAVALKERFCEGVRDLVERQPGARTEGERDLATTLLPEAMALLGAAVGALFGAIAMREKMRRDTIATQLEATRWRGFEEIQPEAGRR